MTVTQYTSNANNILIQANTHLTILAVGGGGGGNIGTNLYPSISVTQAIGSGGGGGQVVYTSLQVTENTYLNITIGQGGATSNNGQTESNGGTTSVSSSSGTSVNIIAYGGQGASEFGGGQCGVNTANPTSGGANFTSNYIVTAGGGGAGAGSVGGNAYQNQNNQNFVGGNGGSGLIYTINGTTYAFGGGGAGASYSGYSGSLNNACGGGQSNTARTNASATNYGGGGGGLWTVPAVTNPISTGYQGVVYLFTTYIGNYCYKNVNIYSGYNINTGATTARVVAQGTDTLPVAANYFQGFPPVLQHTSSLGNISIAGPLGYQINGIDINANASNLCTAYNISGGGGATIPVAIPTWASKISAILIGGGGGGGGGGSTNGKNQYGSGASGGGGGGIGILYPIPIQSNWSNLTIQVANGGSGGGIDYPTAYGYGYAGGQGGQANLTFSDGNYIYAMGGGGGGGGDVADQGGGEAFIGYGAGIGGYGPYPNNPPPNPPDYKQAKYWGTSSATAINYSSFFSTYVSNGTLVSISGSSSQPGLAGKGGAGTPGVPFGTIPNTSYTFPSNINSSGGSISTSPTIPGYPGSGYGAGGGGGNGINNGAAGTGGAGSGGFAQIWFYT